MRENAAVGAPRPPKLVVAALIERDGDGGGEVLVTQRREDQPLGLYWEFPGGKLEPGEASEQALVRELREEIGVEVEVLSVAEVVFFRYPDFDLLMLVYRCQITAGTPRPLEVRDVRYVPLDELGRYEFLPADIPLVQKLASRRNP